MTREERSKALDQAEDRLRLLREVMDDADRRGAGQGDPARRVLAERFSREERAFLDLARTSPGDEG
jgi:hypothetical protein